MAGSITNSLPYKLGLLNSIRMLRCDAFNNMPHVMNGGELAMHDLSVVYYLSERRLVAEIKTLMEGRS